MFRYQELPSEGDYIRRLVLEPGEGEAPLFGRLEQIKLQDANKLYPFEAISYAWGSLSKDQTITLDGGRLDITMSLRCSLLQARYSHRAVALWADGICINQDDEKEKSRQVALMGRIYETSLCTLVCLGPGLNDEDRQCARDVAGLITEVDTFMKGVFEDPNFSWDWNSFPYPSFNDALVRDNRWDTWDRLVQQPLFYRGWVVQEVTLGPSALVLWAEEEIDWMSVLRVHCWLVKRARPLISMFTMAGLSPLHNGLYYARHPKETRTFWPEFMLHRTKPKPALEILHSSRPMLLSDPKDRIYAFMALRTLDNAMPAVQPNYSKDISHLDVYTDFAIKYLEKTWDLDILRFVEHGLKENDTSFVAVADARIGTTASWVPRWDSGEFNVPFVDGAARKITCIEGEQNNSTGFSISFMDGNPVLRVKGIAFDSVKYVSETIRQDFNTPERAVAQVVAIWRALAQQSQMYPGPLGSIDSLAFLSALHVGLYEGDPEQILQSRHNFARHLQSDEPSHPADEHEQDPDAQTISLWASEVSLNRRFVLLGRGYYGVAPKMTREGDLCAIIFGTRVPLILRRVPGKQDQYSVVGPVYVQSKKCCNDGTPYRLGQSESCDDWEDMDLQTEDIMLV